MDSQIEHGSDASLPFTTEEQAKNSEMIRMNLETVDDDNMIGFNNLTRVRYNQSIY